MYDKNANSFMLLYYWYHLMIMFCVKGKLSPSAYSAKC